MARAIPIEIDEATRAQLESMARSRSLPHALVVRASLVLAIEAGDSGTEVAERFGLTRER